MLSASSVNSSSSLSCGNPAASAAFEVFFAVLRRLWVAVCAVTGSSLFCLRFFDGGARSSFSVDALDFDRFRSNGVP